MTQRKKTESIFRKSDGKVIGSMSASKDFKITLPEWAEVIDGEHEIGSKLQPDGSVIIDEGAVAKEAAKEDQRRFVRKRNQLLAASDWTQAPDAPVDQQEWATYRQALRDLPQNTEDPSAPLWPTKPE